MKNNMPFVAIITVLGAIIGKMIMSCHMTVISRNGVRSFSGERHFLREEQLLMVKLTERFTRHLYASLMKILADSNVV